MFSECFLFLIHPLLHTHTPSECSSSGSLFTYSTIAWKSAIKLNKCPGLVLFSKNLDIHSRSQKRKVGRGWGHQQHQTQWIKMNEPRASPPHSVVCVLRPPQWGLWLKKQSLKTLAPAHEEVSTGKYSRPTQTGFYNCVSLESYCVFPQQKKKKALLIPPQLIPTVSQYPSLNFSSNLQFSGRNI